MKATPRFTILHRKPICKFILECIPVRAIIWIMCFTCTLFLYMLRINLSIIILAMVQPMTKGNTTFVPECKLLRQSPSNDSIVAEALHSDEPDGVVFPSLHCLVARWAPPDEKGKFIGALLGGSLGTVITWPLLGAIIEKFGWSWAFIGCGIFVICWTGLWYVFVTDSPEQHPRISEDEKNYIVHSLSGRVSKVKRLPPYKDIFLTVPFWALMILHFGNLWGLFFLMTAGPNFLSSVLGFTLGHTGILAALPYLVRLILGIIFGQIGDYIIKKDLMRKTMIRKSFVVFSHLLPGVFLFIQTLTGCDVTWAIVLISLSLGMNGASTLTNLQNSQDLSPNFAGTLYGIINSVGSTTGFINPAIVGYITSQHNGLDEWHTVFYIGSSVYIACGLIFCVFGTGETQVWNEVDGKKSADGIENTAFEDIDITKNGIENTKV
ncbi:unnamed protein product [Diabrotica balteata]|uniref:Uncharacterized protein n=1 Tax=Diabrotica balteata TaxID=107213 RepID=A0A9N9TB57_DIABA|nr:unnamed protein product [Diabrotica balteata]